VFQSNVMPSSSKVKRSFETSPSTHSKTNLYIPEDVSPQQGVACCTFHTHVEAPGAGSTDVPISVLHHKKDINEIWYKSMREFNVYMY
jgi:hypothetical protein